MKRCVLPACAPTRLAFTAMKDQAWGSDPIHPEGIYACEGCGQTYSEYVNGCVACWDDDLTIDQNRAKYPRRSVRLVVPEVGNLEAAAWPV